MTQPFFIITALIIAVFCGIWPLWAPGWPFNHEELYFAQRTGIIASHLAQGDWFPLWASADNLGLGSPQPALYHKLFSFISGAAYFLSGDMKLSLLLTTAFFLGIGASGMVFLLQTLGAGSVSGLASGICLIFANYTSTNWLVRGALAEFSGAMLIPWGMAFFLRVLRHDHRLKDAIGFGLCVSLLFLAHSVLAYYLVLLLPVLAAALWRSWGLRLHQGLIYRLTLAFVLCLLVLAPVLFAMRQLSNGYELSRILPTKYLPENQLQPLARYFWDNYSFGGNFRNFTVQLDTAPLAVALLGGLWLSWRRRSAPEAWALILLATIVLILQSRAGIWFYHKLPGGRYIQFPWRLLAVATPCLIAAAVLIIHRIAMAVGRGDGAAASAALAMAGLCMINSGPFSKLAYGRYSAQELTAWKTGPVMFSLFGEYVPRTVPLDTPLLLEAEIWTRLQGCQIKEETASTTFEPLYRRFVVECASPAVMALPLFDSPYHNLTINDHPVLCHDLPKLPGLCALTVSAGTNRIEVRMPTFGALLKTGVQ